MNTASTVPVRLPSSTPPRRIAPTLVRAVEIPSHSAPNQKHWVRTFDNGLVTCSCMGWASHKHCRHLIDAAAKLLPWPSFCHCSSCSIAYPYIDAPDWIERVFCPACAAAYRRRMRAA